MAKRFVIAEYHFDWDDESTLPSPVFELGFTETDDHRHAEAMLDYLMHSTMGQYRSLFIIDRERVKH